MSSLKLLHSGGNGVIISAPSSNPAANRTITLNDTYAGDGSFVTANSSGNVGIGTASPDQILHLNKTSGDTYLRLQGGTNQGTLIHATDGTLLGGFVSGGAVGGGTSDMAMRVESGNNMLFAHGTSERMRINSSGDVTVNNAGSFDTYRLAGAGSSVRGHLFKADGRQACTTPDSQLVSFNRLDSDGNLLNFIQNGTLEGNISVSGSSVSYNGGVLTRWSQLKGISSTDKSARPTIYQGTVMSNLDDLCEWEGEENQQLNMTKISDTVGDKDIAGVFWAWDDDDDEIVNDFYIAMTGDMVIRVAASTTVARGDLLISAGDGTAKPQNDDIVRSSTIAKIISTSFTATYEDGSKAYPCVLMAC